MFHVVSGVGPWVGDTILKIWSTKRCDESEQAVLEAENVWFQRNCLQCVGSRALRYKWFGIHNGFIPGDHPQ